VTGTGAAFFDLDRTLIRGASGRVFSAAMRDAGLLSRSIPGESVLFGVFDLFGENLPSMVLARQAAALSKGRSRSAVRTAAAHAVEGLEHLLQPYARGVIESHRSAGRSVVIATTTPVDLIAPFAAHLGVDDVIATRYGVGSDGDTFDGTIDGPFVWSTGKLDAVRAWAAAHDVDLAQSYAYSDSVFDAPLLDAVGHPHVVNPDVRLVALAAAKRWPTLHLDVAPGVARVPFVGGEVQGLLLRLVKPTLFPYVRWEFEGVEHIPGEGPVILVANHRSYFDVAAIAVLVARAGRPVRFLGKKELFDAPIVGQIARGLGAIRVDRGSGSNAPLEEAARTLGAGGAVVIFPQGTIPRGESFDDPVLHGKTGAARLASMTRAPLIPVGMWGTEKVWPREARVPNVLALRHPPTVHVRVGESVDLKYRSADADTKRIMGAISALLPG
jgi:putative phosphoserine phosphatase/1-acylglycerol-3-phosphate O-acyltransferase